MERAAMELKNCSVSFCALCARPEGHSDHDVFGTCSFKRGVPRLPSLIGMTARLGFSTCLVVDLSMFYFDTE